MYGQEVKHKMKKGRHLSNIFDHRSPNARMCFTGSYYAWQAGKIAMDAEWEHHLKWINDNIIDRPKVTEKYTVEQLEEMGMIGIYAKVGGE